MSKTTLTIILVLVVLAVGAYFWIGNSGGSEGADSLGTEAIQQPPALPE